MKQPTVSFVVPVRNDAARLRVALTSIRGSAYPPALIEILVADNGSTDDSVTVGQACGARVLTLPDLPVSAVRNQAAEAAQGVVLAFIDADNEIAPGWAEAAVQILRDERIGAVGAPYVPPAGANWVQRIYDGLRGHRDGQRAVEWLASGNMAIRRDLFIAMGGFDPTLVTCEDVDLCQRIRARRRRIVCDSRMRSVHHGDPATLRAVFLGELWRGQDNLRVSLRRPLSWRSLASVGLSGTLLGGLALVLWFIVVPGTDWRLGVVGALLVSAPVALRSLRLSNEQRSVRMIELARTLAVASVYELGRALALIVRLPHRRRQANPSAEQA